MGIAYICRDSPDDSVCDGDFHCRGVSNRPQNGPGKKFSIRIAKRLHGDDSRIRSQLGDCTVLTENPGDDPKAVSASLGSASIGVPTFHGDRLETATNHQDTVCTDPGSTAAECCSPLCEICRDFSPHLIENDKVVSCTMGFEKLHFLNRQANAPMPLL